LTSQHLVLLLPSPCSSWEIVLKLFSGTPHDCCSPQNLWAKNSRMDGETVAVLWNTVCRWLVYLKWLKC
jgi:hypothetical protein